MYAILLLRLGWCFWLLLVTKTNMQDFDPSLAASLESLAHRHNVATLSLFYRYYLGRCYSEMVQPVPLRFSRGRSTRYPDRLHDFSVTIPRCYKGVYVNSFFPRTARLWNSLHIEWFPLTYDLSGFKSRINRHLLTVGSLWRDFPECFNRFVFLFLVTPCLAVSVQPFMEWIPFEKKFHFLLAWALKQVFFSFWLFIASLLRLLVL